MVVALTALFIALGGTSYAVIKLPAKSVGNRELKSNAVTSAKIKARSVAKSDLAPGALLGARGPRGPAGPAGPAAGQASAEGWKTLTFTGAWTNFGGIWGTAQYRKDTAGHVFLRGLAKKGSPPAIDDTIAVLPPGYAPVVRQMFAANMQGAAVAAAGRVDVLPTGEISWQGGPSTTDPSQTNYTSLNDIIFWTE